MNELNLHFPIVKVDKEQRMVWGIATSEAVDSQGEIVDYPASKKAFDSWVGNIRFMHDHKRVVGKKVDVQYDDSSKTVMLGAYISKSPDGENAWTMVKEGILTGFSIGGNVKKTAVDKVKTAEGEKEVLRLTDYDLTEVSLVDNPANPQAKLVAVKSFDGKLREADVLERVADPRKSEWWENFYKISPSQTIEKDSKQYNEIDTNITKETSMKKEDAAVAEVEEASEVSEVNEVQEDVVEEVAVEAPAEEVVAEDAAEVEEDAEEVDEAPEVEEVEAGSKATFSKNDVADLVKAIVTELESNKSEKSDLSEQLAKVAKDVSSLKEQMSKVAAPTKAKASFVEVEKVAEETQSGEGRMAELRKKADEMAVAPAKFTNAERIAVVDEILKLSRKNG